MKKPTFETWCDKCNTKLPIVASTKILVGREADPSGNGYNNDERDVDLCSACLADLVERAWKQGVCFATLPRWT